MTNSASAAPSQLHRTRTGTGAPMLLIHGIGHQNQMWAPVTAHLSADFDTVAVDLPGFGASAPLPAGDSPSPQRLTDHIEAMLDDLDWPTVHVVGNSLGAWIALELAKRDRARSVCALMPAGLWRAGGGPGHWRQKVLFAVWTTGSRLPIASRAVRNPVLRTLALYGLFGRPWQIPADVASDDVANLRTCDFTRTMAALDGTRFEGGSNISVPVTVVFGGKDPLIRTRETALTDLPESTRVIQHHHLGHVPTWDDPQLVSALIRQSCSTGRGTNRSRA